MQAVFLHLLNVSIQAGWMVPAVLVIRLLLTRAPKASRLALWGLLGVRLVCPVSLKTVFSLLPSAQIIPDDIAAMPTPVINSGIAVVDRVVNPTLSGTLAPQMGDSINPMQIVLAIAVGIWVLGVVAMLAYMLGGYVRLRLRVREAIHHPDGYWLSDRIGTPFVLGVFRPRIYLPVTMNDSDCVYVLAHERAHLKHHDHWLKPIAFLLLSVYWFQPLLWLAYVLFCRDIELSCDERVLREQGIAIKKPYAEALINCSTAPHTAAVCPLAFGEIGAKSRVKAILNYKKPAFWLILMAVILTAAVALCFLTDPLPKDGETPSSSDPTSSGINEDNGVELSYVRTDIENDRPVAVLLWENHTDETICFGPQYRIYRSKDGVLVNLKVEEIGWPAILYTVPPGESREERIDISSWKLNNTYHIRKSYYLQDDPENSQVATVTFYLWAGQSGTPTADNVQFNPYFEATVIEVQSDHLLVEVTAEGTATIPLSQRVKVSTNVISAHPVPNVTAGDNVRVIFNGQVEELDPPKLPKVFAIYLLSDDSTLTPSFSAVVKQVTEGGILVEVAEVQAGPSISGQVWVRISEQLFHSSSDLVVGDTVSVFYDGSVKESYPLQIDGTYSIYEWAATE